MILLMGMKISLTKNPTNPMTTNPIAVRTATLVNSLRSGLWHRLTKRTLSLENPLSGSTTESKASIVKGEREERQREGIRKMEEFREEGDVGVETRLLAGKKVPT
uniref:Uncharacterized protein n=1 Tax=Opuntia streptacantha TaxID=393608 RepID=A0A7C9AFE4_OPUST